MSKAIMVSLDFTVRGSFADKMIRHDVTDATEAQRVISQNAFWIKTGLWPLYEADAVSAPKVER